MNLAQKHKNRILTLLLSAALLAEPAFGMTTIHAAEQPAGLTLTETTEENENRDCGEASPGNSGNSEDSDGSDSRDTGEADVTDSDHTNPDERNNSEGNGNSDNADGQNSSQEGDSQQPETGDTPSDSETPAEQETEADGEAAKDQEPETEESVSENTLEPETSVSENALEAADQENGDDELFSDTPIDYAISSEQKAMKSKLAASMAEFDESQEGKTYAARQVFAFADTEEEAAVIADAYHAELIEYDEGVAVLKLTQGISVGAALRAASSMENDLPPVYPDYYRYAYGEEVSQGNAALSGEEAESSQDNAALTVVEEEYESEDIASEPLAFEGEGIYPTIEAYAEVMTEPGEPNMQYSSPYYQWQHANVGTAYAWFTERENKGRYIKVAVLDTGVTASAADGLRCDIQTNKSSEDSTDWQDGHGHGTHVAGIIAARQDGKGGAGIAPQAEIVNVKVLNNRGQGTDSNIIQGINYAIAENVDIINLSLGGIGYNPAVEKVIDQAYNSGIAIFTAAGNDGGNNMAYPAALDNVICVAATDNNDQRAAFSNYGPWVDLSAPGVNIWSTGINSKKNDGYAVLSGTSQATPVAAGEAAVILSAEEMKSKIPAEKNGARVDALKKIMQENAVPVGAGMGSGVTKLTKIFNRSAAAQKPQAPTIECIDTSNNTAQSLAVKIRAQNGMSIYYTTNGKNPVYKNGEAGPGTQTATYWETLTFDGNTAARGTVKAMAVSASGAVSPIKSITWTLKPYVKNIAISGPARVEKKKAIQLKAVVTPTYAAKKDVVWTLLTEDGKPVDENQIRIDAKKGKITTTAQAAAGKYKVTVTAQDHPDASKAAKAEYTIEVIEPNATIQQLTIQNQTQKPIKKVLWIRQMSAYQTEWDQVSLFDYVVAKEKDTTKAGAPLKEITDREALKGRLQWSSSKPAVASVDNTGKVTGKTPGTATITVKADDNLGKKATITITVRSAVSKITITSDKDRTGGESSVPAVARGKSITLRASVFPEKPTNKKVYWSIAPDPENDATAEDMKHISINRTSGKVTVKANAKPGQYIVTAKAADGQGAKKTRKITVVAGVISEIALSQKMDRNVTLYTKHISAEKPNDTTIGVLIKGKRDECDLESYVVTSSNESVARVIGISYSPSDTAAILQVRIMASGKKCGKTNIVIASTDGSNKKATCTVTVKGGITKAAFTDAPGGSPKVSKLKLFRSGTAAQNTAVLYANISGSEGFDPQAYEVTSNNPKIVEVKSVDKATGKISLEAGRAAVGKAIITLMATDGSKKKAACTVTVANPVSKVHIAPKGNNRNYAARGKSLQLQATLECEYGAVSSKKVTWGIEQDTEKKVAINGSGKITVKKDAAIDSVTVTAKACDGSNALAKYTVFITNPVNGIGLWKDGKKLSTKICREVELITMTDDQDVNEKNELGGYYIYDLGWDNSADTGLSGGATVSSSNPEVMSATVTRVNGKLAVALSADRPGTATITIKAMDGGGSQAKYKFKVV